MGYCPDCLLCDKMKQDATNHHHASETKMCNDDCHGEKRYIIKNSFSYTNK